MKFFSSVVVLTFAFISSSVLAADIEAGKAKSATCVTCHGPGGVSINPLWPNLAGQHEAYLAGQIKAFRDGVRSDPLMTPMVAALTDADIANLAAYFAAQ